MLQSILQSPLTSATINLSIPSNTLPLSIYQSPLTHAIINPSIPSHTCYNQSFNPLSHLLQSTCQSPPTHCHYQSPLTYVKSFLQFPPKPATINQSIPSHTCHYQSLYLLSHIIQSFNHLPHLLQSIHQIPSYTCSPLTHATINPSIPSHTCHNQPINPLTHATINLSISSHTCYNLSSNHLPHMLLSK